MRGNKWKTGPWGRCRSSSDREAPRSPWLCALGDRNQPPIEKQLSESAAGSSQTDGTRAHASQTTFTESTSPASYRRKLEGWVTGRPHSTALHFTVLHFIAFFFTINKRFVTTFGQCHFPNSNCSLDVFVTFWTFSQYFKFFHYLYTCYDDLWSVIFDITYYKKITMTFLIHRCSCLENPRDGGAWWAAVYGVAQSWTRLKQLSSSSKL